MAVFRVERNKGYTVMSNHHLRNKELSLKAKGLLSQMLSLPEDWDYTLKGLSLPLRGRVCFLPPPSRIFMKRLRRFSHAPGQTSPQGERPYLRRVGKSLNADTGRR